MPMSIPAEPVLDASPGPHRFARRSWPPQPLAVLALAGSVATYVSLVSPLAPGHYPTCPFLMVTGWYCPGCGSLRALHELVHREIWSAIGYNLFAVVMVPLLAYWWLRWVRRRSLATGPAPLAAAWLGWLLLASLVVFWIVRNLPIGAALAP
jgi:Protein of unknown function (DUF2752)